MLANTIAHELSHARDFQKGLSSAEGPVYASGDPLEEWKKGSDKLGPTQWRDVPAAFAVRIA